MKKNLLIVYHPKVENEVTKKILYMIIKHDPLVKDIPKHYGRIDILPLLSNFILVKTLSANKNRLDQLQKSLHISGFETYFEEHVEIDVIREVVYKSINKMEKISVSDNVKLLQQLEVCKYY